MILTNLQKNVFTSSANVLMNDVNRRKLESKFVVQQLKKQPTIWIDHLVHWPTQFVQPTVNVLMPWTFIIACAGTCSAVNDAPIAVIIQSQFCKNKKKLTS